MYRRKRRQCCIRREQCWPFAARALRGNALERMHGLLLEGLDVNPAQLSDVPDRSEHARDVLGKHANIGSLRAERLELERASFPKRNEPQLCELDRPRRTLD